MTSEITTILDARRLAATKMLKKFERKASRYGVAFSFSFGEPREEERHEGNRKYKVQLVDVTITGDKPVVGDYEFLAAIEFTPAGNFVDTVPGVKLPTEYRTTDARCEHCHATRQRRNVFVVRNREDGSLMQVGRTCLRDFLGTDDPKWIIQRFSFFRSLGSALSEEEWGGFGGSSYWADDLQRVLAISLASVRLWGWVSKGHALNDDRLTPTVNRYHLFNELRDKYNAEDQDRLRDELRDEDWATATTIQEWVRSTEDNNDYMWNLRLAFQDDVITDPKRLGLAVSAVSAWHRAQERELKVARSRERDVASRHQGSVKERLKDLHVRLETRRGMGDNGWGWTELLKMRDEAGNLYTWFTGAAPALDIGASLVIAGTVKAHKEFNGIQETLLTRVRVS